MSEEFELNEGDLVVPAPADFSMFDMLDAVEYPEEEVTVALNEKAAFQLSRLSADIKRYMADNAEHDDDVLAEYRSQLDELRQKIDDSKVTFFLKGVPDEILTGANDIAEAKFEDRKRKIKDASGAIQNVLPQAEKLNFIRFMNATVYSMHVYKVRYHKNGAETGGSPDEIAAFMDRAPEAAKGIFLAAIAELRVAAAEYESNFDEGFFPKS